ncbi:NADPH-dependent 2,4-dienoyl-CoA reductase, sulfur reductase [Desulfonatronum thiosulfatophilum]|uniref:NADPH-dependent 2,4-dienoyl-CoA reductase, sulfur reductase n=1 Tax=Desulfonatronum thiosulfatophilum TaxID=617002 RepID=A0A1G6CYC1_9BACT|nr:FAD-dependent oxidoreductase [Desulfonatronum thiosulfatophilum]SDB37675.1 NADPH-dependent 2,4-dienoyl-CoA reductase, sulfur reductase [Desulfonatronum thiosulfatophilum]
MPQHIVIIGAVALGSKAAARFKRLEPDSRVTLVDRGKLIAYSGCGIPYYVSGEVNEERELQSTAFHMLRDTEFFRKTKGVDVRIETEALAIDRKNRTVNLRHLPTGNEEILAYDQLVLATGSTPFQLRVPGTALQGVHTIQDPESARQIRSRIAGGKVKRAVVIGAGFIGMEMAVALADLWDVPTTVIEYRDQILPGVIGNNLARMAQRRMEQKGITFLLGEQAKAFESDDQTHVARVAMETTTLPADLVIVAVGVRPNSALARQAGLEVSERGAVQVDEYLRTSDPHIFAGGDCVDLRHLLTDMPVYLPMGSLANRQGRIIGDNLAGGRSKFSGVTGSWCVKLFDLAAAGTGLTLQGAKNAGFNALSVHVSQLDRAHFFPEKGLMSLELVIERDTGRMLGLQGLADMGDALVGKVNVVAALLPSAPNARMLSSLEMAYSPPFSAALDILNVLGNVADNILANRYRGIHADDFAAMWKEREHNDLFFLDCRETLEAEKYAHAHPEFWHNIPQGELAERLKDIPENHRLVLICNTGARAYEALVTLNNANFNDVVCVEGGMTALTAAGVQV